MAYQATAIPIMIASPGDVYEEREVIREVLYTWNYINAQQLKTVLMPVGWETHSSPELGLPAQDLINKRILKDCDILIGVFWTKIGSPTNNSISGSVEEIETHVSEGKPALIYFSSKPVVPDSVDPEQYKKLKEFRESLMKKGLIEFFDNILDFKEKLSRQISICLQKNEYLLSVLPQTQDASLLEIPAQVRSRIDLISEQAKVLLKLASTTQDGKILRVSVIGGTFIKVAGQTFGGQGRESARWEHSLKELCDFDLATPIGGKGQVFQLTHAGWSLADDIPEVETF